MKRPVMISPSLLSADFARLKDEIELVEAAGADLLHLDVMDGHFVPNLTIGPGVVAAVKRHATKPLDVHLMLDNPDVFVPVFADAGSDMIAIHAEVCHHLQRSLEQIRKRGVKAGIAINPATPVGILEYSVEYADFVLVMTVNPGFGGQSYLPNMTRKIRDVRALIDRLNPSCLLEMDGGTTVDNAAEIVGAGADILVAGNAVFSATDKAAAIARIKGLK